jgi:hypothetical protein
MMASIFWDRKRGMMVEFMQQGSKITSEVYCETLKGLHRAIQKKKMWNADIRCSAPP